MKKMPVVLSISDPSFKDIYYFEGYKVLWMPSEEFKVLNDTILVVGHTTTVWRTSTRRTTLANKPNGLLVRKISSKGNVGSQLYLWNFEDKKDPVPNDIRKQFWDIFPTLAAYSVYDRHQLEIANDNVEEYCGYGWNMPPDVVCDWMNSNKYFWDLRHSYKAKREDRILEARNSILEVRAKWFADDNMSGIFDTLMAPIHQNNDDSDFMTELRSIDSKINKVKNEIRNSHKYEDMSYERNELAELQSKFNRIMHDNYSDIPKNSLGFPVIYANPY